jgi:hypothetical protein
MCGVFSNIKDFRDYATGAFEEKALHTRNHLELVVNDYNPILSEPQLNFSITNNRLITYEGEISINSPDRFLSAEKRKVTEDNSENINFTVATKPDTGGIGLLSAELYLTSFAKIFKRALLTPNEKVEISAEERDRVLTVANGSIRFSSSLDYSDALFSLQYKDFEWIYSKYPNHEPYSWWNPFIGGIQTRILPMRNMLTLREERDAFFVSETDIFGNKWSGIQTDVYIEKYSKYRGIKYSQYFLTLPGVPVLAHYTRIINDSGHYQELDLEVEAFLSGEEGLKDIYACYTTDDNTDYYLRMGASESDMVFDRFVTLSREGESKRAEKMYIFKDAKRDRGECTLGFDVNHSSINSSAKAFVENGKQHVTRPLFVILSEKELTLEALTDLERVYFE